MKLFLTWIDVEDETHNEQMDETFKVASQETFNELKFMCEKWVDNALAQYGNKEYVYRYSPYQKIYLWDKGKVIASWNVHRYLKGR